MAGKIETSSREMSGYLARVNTAAASQRHSLEEIIKVGELLKKAALMLEESGSKIKLEEEEESTGRLAPLVDLLTGELLNTADQTEIRSMEPDSHRAALSGFLKRHSGLEAAWSNRADGTFIFSEPPAGLANARIRQWWKQAMAGENYVSSVYLSAITRKPCLTLSVPFRDSAGSVTGVLGADLTWVAVVNI